MKHPNDWHLLEKNAVLNTLAVDMYKGLSDAEVRRRRRSAGSNGIWHIPRASAGEVAMSAIFDLATLLLMISAVAATLFDKSIEAGALVVLLFMGGILRTVTYIRANRILEDSAKQKIPTVSVIRNGRITLVSASEIVSGDIVVLEPGDTVPADGRVIAGDDSVVSERGITDNKTPVHKFDTTISVTIDGEVPCEFRSNMLFAGSLVLSGSLRMAVTSCGEAALISRKQGGIMLPPVDKLPVVEKLRIWSKTSALVMLACVMILTALSLFRGENTSLSDVFFGTMSMAVAAMSEFLTIIATIMIAVAVRDAGELTEHSDSSARAVIRQPEKIEDIINVRRMVFCGSSFFKSGRSELYAYRSKGKYSIYNSVKKNDNSPDELISLALAASAGNNMGISSGSADIGHTTEIDKVIKRAADSFVRKSGRNLTEAYALYDHKGASERNTMGMEISLIDREGDVWAVAVGSIDTVLRCCTSAETADGTEPLTEELQRKIFTECARLEFGGANIVAVALRKSPYLQLNRVAVLTQYMTFVGFLAVSEEPEENAVHNLEYLKNAGVTPILFTENPDADLYYCHRIGLFNKKTLRINASQLNDDIVDSVGMDGMIVSFADVQKTFLATAYSNAMKIVMHDRVSGADKLLQEEDEAAPLTAAVGRETWDSGVLAAADIGIATARSKIRTVPEILTKNATVIVHREGGKAVEAGFGGLGGIVRAMRMSSRVLCNISAAKFYLTASQIARLVVILSAVLFDIPLLSAVFILIWGLLFDFAAVLMMSFEKYDDSVIRRDEGHHETVASAVVGVCWGVLVSSLLPALRFLGIFLGFSFDETVALAILSSAIVLSGAVLAFLSVKLMSRCKNSHINTAGLLFLAATIVLAFVLTTVDASVIGGAECGWFALFALIPAVIIAGAFKIAMAIFERHKARLNKAVEDDLNEEKVEK